MSSSVTEGPTRICVRCRRRYRRTTGRIFRSLSPGDGDGHPCEHQRDNMDPGKNPWLKFVRPRARTCGFNNPPPPPPPPPTRFYSSDPIIGGGGGEGGGVNSTEDRKRRCIFPLVSSPTPFPIPVPEIYPVLLTHEKGAGARAPRRRKPVSKYQ